MGARVLTGLQPGDVQKLKDSVETTNPSAAISIIQKASTAAAGFTQSFDQIPVFAIGKFKTVVAVFFNTVGYFYFLLLLVHFITNVTQS